MEPLLPILHGMVDGMATAKITITLPDRQLEEIRKRVAARNSPSVSGFIQEAVQKSLENAAEFRCSRVACGGGGRSRRGPCACCRSSRRRTEWRDLPRGARRGPWFESANPRSAGSLLCRRPEWLPAKPPAGRGPRPAG